MRAHAARARRPHEAGRTARPANSGVKGQTSNGSRKGYAEGMVTSMTFRRLLATRMLAFVTAGLALLLFADGGVGQGTSDTFSRDHEHGVTTLRFEKGHFQLALILNARPRENAGRKLVTASGREIPLDWSGRSAWIDHAKFELPFGAVFLLNTRDSTRAQQLEFNAASGRLLLDQAAAAPKVAQWLHEHGQPRDTVMPGAVQAATYPRHTLEVTDWSYHGIHALTCLVSGEPLFVLFSPVPLRGGSSTQTMMGNLASVEVQVGDASHARTWRATRPKAVFGDHTYDFSQGRVFVISASGEITQVQTALGLGPESASRIADEIERVPEVRAFLRLE